MGLEVMISRAKVLNASAAVAGTTPFPRRRSLSKIMEDRADFRPKLDSIVRDGSQAYCCSPGREGHRLPHVKASAGSASQSCKPFPRQLEA